MNGSPLNAADPHGIRHLDQTLMIVLMDLFRNSILPGRPTRLTAEVFICGLYKRYPEETAGFFENPDRLEEFVAETYSEPLRDSTDFPREEFAQVMVDRSPGEVAETRARGFDVPLDSSLVGVFLEGAKLARTKNREKTNLADFFDALSRDAQIKQKVQEKTGLRLKKPVDPA